MPFSKRVFITGIAGFIGFHLAEFLAKQGHSVSGCDNFNDYYDPNLKRYRADLLQKKKIKIAELDLLEEQKLEQLISQENISHLVHLAAQAGVRYSNVNPKKYLESNICGFFNILEILKKYPQIKCVFASSSSVYGLNDRIPFVESDSHDRPANFYAATKIANEAMAHSYHHLYGISLIGLRYFTVYGPWGRPDMAYFSFTKNIIEGKPITLHNFGKMKRDFTYIDDIIQGTAAALNVDEKFEIFNLGNHQPIELEKLISIIEHLTGKKAMKQFVSMEPGEAITTFAAIKKSKKKLKFMPTTTLEEGMAHFVDWYKKFY
ncbi:MAG: NAD-dependent epimerase/dehydratase family protein [Chlamydiae bacterium]|nr:NAD-dependent epimerase/dehydratase family protein [Chlamydiota bacterium]